MVFRPSLKTKMQVLAAVALPFSECSNVNVPVLKG